MKHIKNREEVEFDKEQKALKRRKNMPKRYRQKPVNRKAAFSEEELERYSPQEPVSKTTKSESIKRLITAAVICILCGCVVFVYANKDKISFEAISNWVNYDLLGKSRGEGYPVDINGTNIELGNVDLLDGKYFFYVSDTACVTLKSNGSELYSSQIRYSKPVAKVAGTYGIVYNLDGKGYQILTASGVQIDGTAENNIFYGTINKNGTYALITKSDGYLSKLYVYDKKGNLKYSYSFSEYYAYCADINDDGTQAIVGAVSTKNGAMQSLVYLLDLNSEEPTAVTSFDNSTVFSVEYLSNNIAAVICDDSSIVCNLKQGTQVKNEYDGRVLAEYCINNDTGCFALVLSRSGDGRMCDIDYYNSLGEKENTVSTDLKISSVSMYKDKIAVLAEGTIYEYNKEGELLYSADAGSSAKIIKLLSENEAYVVGISDIRFVDFRSRQQSSGEEASEN